MDSELKEGQQLRSKAKRRSRWILTACFSNFSNSRGRLNRTERRTKNSLTDARSLEGQMAVAKMVEACEDMHEVAWR